MRCTNTIVALFMLIALPCITTAEDAPGKDKRTVASNDREDLYKLFEKKLSGVKLVGQFTILGRDTGDLPSESYTINSVKKMSEGDYWLFNARIQYGDKDVAVPLPLEVKWAGNTPVITLTDFTIPAMGTFSSRVVIYKNKYAGTWTHGKVGGHLFGVIEKVEESDAE